MADKKTLVAGTSPATVETIQAGDYATTNTPPASDNSTRVASTAYVQGELASLRTPDFILQTFGIT